MPEFIGIDMLDESTGWGLEANGYLLRTTDGGLTWKDVTPPETGFYFTGDKDHAWSVHQGQVPCTFSGCSSDWMVGVITWLTMNGGESWERGGTFPGGIPEFRPIEMQFIDNTSGWFLFTDQIGMSGFSYQSLVTTTDGGQSWSSITPPQSGCIPNGMVFLDDQNGWIGTDCRTLSGVIDPIPLQDLLSGKATPVLSHTTDGGVTWTDAVLPSPETFPPSILSAGKDVAVHCGTWYMERISSDSFYLQWSCVEGNPGVSRSLDIVYLTVDGGETWRSWLSTRSEQFIDPLTGWRLSSGENGQPVQLQQTTDGGMTWQTIRTVGWQSARLDFTSKLVGWAIASDGTNSAIIYTNDGGLQWTEIKPIIVQ